MKISVVVPVYKGKKYINRIIEQIEVCSRKLDEEQVELLLINDCPEECIEERKSNSISIRVFNTEINRGIQGARIRGCELSEGEYILILDQDDIISDDYLKSQFRNIKESDTDASVCRARENNRDIYNATNPFERVIDPAYMSGIGNAIVSPGQVLLKKSAISDIWKTHILKHNGADDWFLWLCMIGEQKKFVLNQEVLFEHIVNGNNTSWNSEEMLLSEKEMYNVIKEVGLFSLSVLKGLERLIAEEQLRYIHVLEKYRGMFFLYDKWMSLENKKGNISTFLCEQGYKRIAVYGLGFIGKQLINRLRNTDVCVLGAIDVNAAFIDADILVTRLDEFEQKVDLVITTPIQMTKELLFDVKRKADAPVVTLQELLERWERGEGIPNE